MTKESQKFRSGLGQPLVSLGESLDQIRVGRGPKNGKIIVGQGLILISDQMALIENFPHFLLRILLH